MATYLDLLACEQATDNDDKVSNENLELLHDKLFSYVEYVMLMMDYRKTGQIDDVKVERCILHMFNNCNGIADITTCCRVFVESLDDICTTAPIVAPVVQRLIKKYQTI